MTIFNVLTLMGGVALFLLGMNLMGSGLEKLAGGKLEGILQKLTSNIFKAVLLGAVITGVIQSSAATTVIVIGLVNSGIMKFRQGIGIIMGANIGTTVTAQIIRLSDIEGDNLIMQLLKPNSFAPALALVGVILYCFMKGAKKNNIGQILIGFGILFMGMQTMETSVAPLQESPVFLNLFASLTNPVFGILAGAVVTFLMQSSSASVGVLQALTATGAVTWGNAIPIILGQNIGTTATGLISSTGASKQAKRIAIVHLYFNVVGTVLFIVAIYGIKAAVGLSFWNDPISKGSVADFHTFFNVVATLIFIPFNGVLAWLAEKTVPIPEGETHPELQVTVLDQRLYNSPSVAIGQARKAVEQMGVVGRLNQRNAIPLLLDYSNEEKVRLAEQREEVIDKLDVSVSNYLVDMNKLDLSDAESHEVTRLLNFVTEFERIGDYAINVVQRGGEVHDKKIVFSEQAKHELEVLNAAVGEIFDHTLEAFLGNDMYRAAKVEPLEETIDLICEALRDKHIKRLKNGVCSIDAGIVFLEVLTDYERISDHCSNVAARMLSAGEDIFDPHALRRDLHTGANAEYLSDMAHYKEKYLSELYNFDPKAPKKVTAE